MWVFTTDGFVSIVKDRSEAEPQKLVVRARRESTLKRFLQEAGLGGKTVYSYPKADYRFRVFVTAKDVADWLAARVLRIDYPNFKQACKDEGADTTTLSVLNGIWSEGYRLQEEEPRWSLRNGALTQAKPRKKAPAKPRAKKPRKKD